MVLNGRETAKDINNIVTPDIASGLLRSFCGWTPPASNGCQLQDIKQTGITPLTGFTALLRK